MGKNWAIVVGINNYDNLQPLKYALRDAEAMQAWFKHEAKFDEVFLFTEDSLAIPTNPPIPTLPTQGRFKRFLNVQFAEPLLKPEDNLWFFFAGYGKRFQDQDYLMFIDTDPTDCTTAISVDYVTQRLNRCGANKVVLLIDAYRDEGSGSGLGVRMQEHKGVITFYSSTANQKYWDIDELQDGSIKDVQPLKLEAFSAENRGDLLLAKQLWRRVIAVSRNDDEAIEAIERIALKRQHSFANTITESLSITQAVATSGGDRAVTSEATFESKNNLKIFQFDVVTVNAQGQEIKIEQRQAEYFSENLGDGISLDMVLIPGGSLMMGTPENELERHDSEDPQIRVNIQQFCIGKYPVTQEQWKAVAALPQINRELEAQPSHFQGDKRPVERVCWYDAVEFCLRLTAHTKRQYRLPSEAEWEYACRAGTTTPFHFGQTITSELANYNAEYTYGAGVLGTYRKNTTVVGSFGVANAFGLYDMHGNVWEWCLDDWHDNYEGAPTDGSAWFNYNDKLYQKQGYTVLRGGSWINEPDYCRSGSRGNNPWAERGSIDYIIGFRVVCGWEDS